jgi:hypothetical protein
VPECRQRGEARGVRDQLVLLFRLYHSPLLSIGFIVPRTQ